MPSRRRAHGQVIPIAAIAMVAIMIVTALILEGGNAYAQQRQTQNAADSAANAGATVLAKRFSDGTIGDPQVRTAMQNMADANGLATWTGFYTNVKGQYMNAAGTAPVAKNTAATVGGGVVPPGAQGVAVDGSRNFDAFVGRIIGLSTLTSSADATAVTGVFSGGAFIPVVFPVNIVDCNQNGSLGSTEVSGGWQLSQPPAAPGARPIGPEYIVPLCKTGGGSFQILDFDPSLKCDEEVAQGITYTINLPDYVPSDNGNDCAKKIVDVINSLHGKVVNVPICDNGPDAQHPIGNCDTSNGSNAEYHIVKVASFWVDYMSESNNANQPNSDCQAISGVRTFLPGTDIDGNGSSSCLVGYFVRYVTAGTVGSGTPDANNDTIGIQLIK
jgi:Flp pilus assembly protein TadG